jgi:hypothetical protein
MVAGTWGAAASSFCRARLSEGESIVTSIFFRLQKKYDEKFPKMAKITKENFKFEKYSEKLRQN